MPDVGLTSFTEPLSDDMRVIVKYTVEVNGLPVYSETYNVQCPDRGGGTHREARRSQTELAAAHYLRRRVPETPRIFRMPHALSVRRQVLRRRP